VLTTPEAWRGYLGRYDELYPRSDASDQEIADLLDEDEVAALEEGGRIGRVARGGAGPGGDRGRGRAAAPSALPAQLANLPGHSTGDGRMRVSGWVDLVHPCARVA
jgi:hypothetical protein